MNNKILRRLRDESLSSSRNERESLISLIIFLYFISLHLKFILFLNVCQNPEKFVSLALEFDITPKIVDDSFQD